MSKPSSTDAPEAIKISDELKDSLKEIAKSCKKEDEEIFKAMRRQWKKAEEFWKGVQYLFWDSTSGGEGPRGRGAGVRAAGPCARRPFPRTGR